MSEHAPTGHRGWRFVTQHTVYYVWDGVCVRIDPLEGELVAGRHALGLPLVGGFSEQGELIPLPEEIPRGARLLFDAGAQVIRTSPIHFAEAITEESALARELTAAPA
jgi:hypothetical protein